MRRQEFIAALGGTAVWPMVARAQPRSPQVIGFLDSSAPTEPRRRLDVDPFLRGLAETGFVEGRNVTIEYRWSNDHPSLLSGLAADPVHRQVAVIVTQSTSQAALTAKAATQTIPIVYRPSSNVTGVTFLSTTLGPKPFGLLRDILPSATLIGVLANSKDWGNQKAFDDSVANIRTAAKSYGCELVLFNAGTDQQIEGAFDAIVQRRIAALLVNADAFLSARRDKIFSSAARHAIPTMYSNREDVRGGGLMSYGVELLEYYRQAGSFTGRILKGAKPADLPVIQPTKFELVINLTTAKALGLTIPGPLLATADEVIQ
jgi:putative ABC transport system substrate-binding protein